MMTVSSCLATVFVQATQLQQWDLHHVASLHASEESSLCGKCTLCHYQKPMHTHVHVDPRCGMGTQRLLSMLPYGMRMAMPSQSMDCELIN